MAIEKRVPLAFIATLYICVIQRAGGATFQIENNCPFTVWAAGSPGGGKQLQKGQSWTLQVPADTGSGTFWGRTGCSFDGSGRGSCDTGDCEGLNCTQLWGEVPVTRAVYYLQYPHYQNLDLYSISLLGGFNLPMSIIPSDSQCEAIACNRNITAFCPTELTISGGCKRDCVTFGSNSCNYSTYTEFFKSQCTQAHSSATDQDSSWTFHCPGGTDYRVVFCGGTDTSLQGFQNIDCGGTSNHTGQNNITWVTDDNYIDVGDKADTGNASLPFYLQRLRLFPKPLAKSCYRLPVAPSVPHLFRLWFCDGNNRSFQKWRSFAFSIETQGLLAVENFTITNLLPIYYEGILVSAGNVLHICLIRTSENDVPFINAIELRRLRDGMYRQAKPGTMLSLISRQHLGGISSIRYPQDNFDRIWTSDVSCSTALQYANWREFSSSNNTENFPPTAVMQTAWVTNGDRFEFSIPTTYRAKSLLMLYFAEIETSNISGSRSFYVTINGETRSRTINVAMDYSAMELTFISNITDDFKFDIVKATNSTKRPILNAFEYYSLHDTYQATSSEDIEALDAIKKRIDRKDWISDPCYLMQWDGISCANTSSAIRISEINLSRRNLTGGIPENIGQLTAVVNVSLDNNNLVGQLPDFSNLTILERLHLQNNNLSGSVPDWLSQLKNLKQLFIDNNNFSGTIPTQLLDKPSLNITYSGNHYLCMDKRTCQRISRKDKTSVVLGITISGALLLVLALTVGIAVYHKKLKTEQHLNEDNSMIMVPNPTKPHFLTLEEIVQATQNFSRKIGQGGFGSVFFGKLPEGNDIAVKVLSLFSREGVHQFQNEVDLLSKIHHKNLVSLLGYCNESRELMLIYEYMSHGSLKDHLYGSCAEVSQLNWKTRLQIALDAAQGLEYLHMGCNPKIIHRDIKAANILLDGNMNAKLADFGLSRITINGEASGVTTVVKGTIGYLDPEYYRSRRLTEKSDVYSFGVVLLEIICGRAPINENLPEDELNLIEWVMPYVEMDENLGDIAVIIDKRLGGNYEMKSVAGIVKLAFRCVEAKPFCRPNVTEVVAQIRDAIIQENENDVPLPNLERIGTEDEDVQTSLARSRVESRPKEMEWADNSSNLAKLQGYPFNCMDW